MKSIIRPSTIVCVVALAATVAAQLDSPGASDAGAEQAVASRLSEIQEAAQMLDADEVFRFVAENDKGALVEDGRILLTRAEALKSTRQGFRGLRELSYRFDQQHITLLSPTIAIAVGEGTSSATTDNGRVLSTRFAQSVVLTKSNGEWKVAHAHRSLPPAD